MKFIGFKRYNSGVNMNIPYRWILFLNLLVSLLIPPASVLANPIQPAPAQSSDVTPFDLIVAMNTLRTSNGLPALVEDPIIDAVAQSTADIMAANEMSWHIGDVRGRLAAAGYGGGATVWATENFAMGNNSSIDEIMLVWSDDSHMLPAVKAAYCNVGAGTAKSPNGMTYYVLQAAYTSNKACGEYKSPGGTTTNPDGSTTGGRAGGGSQLIVPVKIATPGPDGKIIHLVQAGQSFWSIAVAYKLTIKDLETWNNIRKENGLQIGQKLFIPGANTAGYFTPTVPGSVQVSKPDQDGKIIHTVQSYQTLTTIAAAYGTSIDALLILNAIRADWPLQIGQKLVINAGNITPSPTPRPLTPIEKLTPASDGKYYHIIQSGETLSWIADLYKIKVADLMAWNGLNESSILQPKQRLLLEVTPPATATPDVTTTPTARSATDVPPTSTPTLAATLAPALSATPTPSSSSAGNLSPTWFIILGLAACGVVLFLFYGRRK